MRFVLRRKEQWKDFILPLQHLVLSTAGTSFWCTRIISFDLLVYFTIHITLNSHYLLQFVTY